MQFLGRRALSFFMLLVFFSVIPTTQTHSQESQTPYIYYFSDILHSFVIEQPDGSDSRQFADGIIPEDHNSVSGAGWSPSGQWFAVQSCRTTTHSAGESQNRIISADEQVVISLPDGIFAQIWSPTEDLLLYVDKTQWDQPKIALFDPTRQETIFEYVADGYVEYRWGIYWNSNGSKIAWQITRGTNTFLYDLSLPDFELTETIIESNVQLIDDFNDQFVLFTYDDELIFHDIFSHQETRYPFEFTADTSGISIWFNHEKTEAFVTILDRQNQNTLNIFWISLSENRIESIYSDDTGSDSCSYCVDWNPSGDTAIIQTQNETITISTSTAQQSILDTSHSFILWLNDNQALFESEYSPESVPELNIFNTENGQYEAVDLPIRLWRGSYISESEGYLLIDDTIFTIPSFEILARSQISAPTYGSFISANQNANWVIMQKPSYHPMSGYRSMNYEAVELNSTRTRELTTCYGNLCWGWLPAQVDLSQLGQASLTSVVPEPIQTILVNEPIQSVMWSEDDSQIHVISAFRDAEEATLSIWDIVTETIVQQYDIPYCSLLRCRFDGQPASSEEITLPISNDAESLQLAFDTEIRNYIIRDLESSEILHQWTENDFPPNGGAYHHWVQNTLFLAGNSTRQVCAGYWHRLHDYIRTSDLYRCDFSSNEDFILFMYTTPTDKSFLIDTATGDATLINFYARGGAFSPDGTQIALGTGYRLTIWDVEDIISINQ